MTTRDPRSGRFAAPDGGDEPDWLRAAATDPQQRKVNPSRRQRMAALLEDMADEPQPKPSTTEPA